jgi:FdhE protein
MTPPLDLRDAWRDLLSRRQAFASTLTPYTELLERWADASDMPATLWSRDACAAAWSRGVPLLAERRPTLSVDAVEDLLGAVMEQLAVADPGRAGALQRLATAWDAGAVTPFSLMPTVEGIGDGAVEAASGLDPGAVTFLACATLRPALERWLQAAHDHADAAGWGRGVCPFCGAPPGFIDVVEGGHRRLACHFCGGGWPFPKLRCPLCGAEGTEHMYRLKAEAADEGYVVSGCKQCHGYLKELDRRERWNGGPPLLEDWSTPHLDVVARREGYRKPIPSLLDLVARR